MKHEPRRSFARFYPHCDPSVFSLAVSCKIPQSSKNTFRETIPEEVRAEISSQIKLFLGHGPFRGVPLLDGRVDWNDAQHWPDEFSFRDFNFKACYGTFGSDWFGGPNSRDALRANKNYYIQYKVDLPAPLYWHSFHSWWSKHGYVKEKGVTWGHKTIFSLQFYPSGVLSTFIREHPQAGYRIDYYDPSGRKIGSNYDHSRYTWRGMEVTRETLHENLQKIWVHFPPED